MSQEYGNVKTRRVVNALLFWVHDLNVNKQIHVIEEFIRQDRDGAIKLAQEIAVQLRVIPWKENNL